METTNITLISSEDLGKYAAAKMNFNVPTTVLSGALRAQVTELNKNGDENKKAQAAAILKSQTFTLSIDFVRCPLPLVFKMVVAPQSLIVSLQNGLLRPLGDDNLKKIARGDDFEIPVSDGVKFHAKNKVVYILVKSWLARPKTVSGMTPEQKLVKEYDKMEDSQQDAFIVKSMADRMMKKDPNLKLEEALKKAEQLL